MVPDLPRTAYLYARALPARRPREPSRSIAAGVSTSGIERRLEAENVAAQIIEIAGAP